MRRLLVLLLPVAILVCASASPGGPPPVFAKQLKPQVEPLPVGNWRIEFTNGVVETCRVSADATANVREPLRQSAGKAVLEDGSVIITFEDERVERWTPIGPRMVVEHWSPPSLYPTGRPVVGIAEKMR